MCPFFGNGKADEPASMSGEKSDMFWRHDIGGDDQVTLIFTILVVHNKDHLSLAKIIQDLFYSIYLHTRL
jgi:hypothetical protein